MSNRLNVLVGATLDSNVESQLNQELSNIATKLSKIPINVSIESTDFQNLINNFQQAVNSFVQQISNISVNISSNIQNGVQNGVQNTTNTTKNAVNDLTKEAKASMESLTNTTKKTSSVVKDLEGNLKEVKNTGEKLDGMEITIVRKYGKDENGNDIVTGGSKTFRNVSGRTRDVLVEKRLKQYDDVKYAIDGMIVKLREFDKENGTAFADTALNNYINRMESAKSIITDPEADIKDLEYVNRFMRETQKEASEATNKAINDMMKSEKESEARYLRDLKFNSQVEEQKRKDIESTIKLSEEAKQAIAGSYEELERFHMKNGTTFDAEPINKYKSELDDLVKKLNSGTLNQDETLAIHDRIGQITSEVVEHTKRVKQEEQDRLQILKKVTSEQERQHKKQLELSDTLRDMGKLSGGIFTDEALARHKLTSANLNASRGVIDNEASLTGKINGIKGHISRATTEQLYGNISNRLSESGKELDDAFAKVEKRLPVIKDGFNELGKVSRIVTEMNNSTEFINMDDSNEAKKELDAITNKAIKCLKVLSDPGASYDAIKKAKEEIIELNNQSRSLFQSVIGSNQLQSFDKIEKDRQKSLESARALAEDIANTFDSKQRQIEKYSGTELFGDLLSYNEEYTDSFQKRLGVVVNTLKSETLSTVELANAIKELNALQKEANSYDKSIDNEYGRLEAVKKSNKILDEQYKKIQESDNTLFGMRHTWNAQDEARTNGIYKLHEEISEELRDGNISLERRVELEKKLQSSTAEHLEYVRQREKEEKERRDTYGNNYSSWWDTKLSGQEYQGNKTDVWKKNIRNQANEITSVLNESFEKAYQTGFTEKHAKELDALEVEYQDIISILKKENVEVYELIDAYEKLLVIERQVSSVSKGINSSIGASVDVDNALNKYNAETERLAVELRSKFGNLFNEAEFRNIRDVNKQISTLLKQHGYDLKQVNAILGNAKANTNQFKERLEATDREIKQINKDAEILDSSLCRFVQFYAFGELFRFGRDMARSMFEQIKEVDSAMVELKKVTDESQLSYEKFLDKSSDKAKELGVTMSDYITSVTEFARAGQSFGDSQILAESANVMQMVAENLTAEQASEYLISTMAGFNIEAEKSMSIVDALNNVSNNFSITTDG